MIKNDQQMTITTTKLEGLQERLFRLKEKYPKEQEFEFYSESTQRQIRRMQQELNRYQLAKQGEIDGLLELWNEHGTLSPNAEQDLSLGEFICLMRVARGLTQEQMAQALGLQQANIARYEKSDYTGYSLDTLDRFFKLLGVRMTLGKLDYREAA